MSYDAIIMGAGIAGASLAAELAPHMRVLLLEREEAPGYHTTGRSNAYWHATYGGPGVVALTLGSRSALEEGGFLSQRGALTLAQSSSQTALEAMRANYEGTDIRFEMPQGDALAALVPGLRPAWTSGLLEPDCFDIDVAGFHASCLARVRQAGGEIRCRAEVLGLGKSAGVWTIATPSDPASAPIVINAAGAWADGLAQMAGVTPLGVQPYRRTITQLLLAHDVPGDMPFVIDVEGSFYFRTEGGNRVWVSPHDETPSAPCDAAPEELDVAIAIDHFQKAVDWDVVRVERSWAGLRSFALDRLPVLGEDPRASGFWWCAGQGGFGIQTAPAVAKLIAAQILGEALPDVLVGVRPETYAPSRPILTL